MKYLVTIHAPSKEQAQAFVDALLEKRVVACAHITEGTSHYMWKGERQNEQYFTVTAYTTKDHTEAIVQTTLDTLSEEVPGVVFTEIADGHQPFLQWIEESCTLETL